MESKLFTYTVIGLLSAILILTMSLLVSQDSFERDLVKTEAAVTDSFEPDTYSVTVGYTTEGDNTERVQQEVSSQIEDIKAAIYAEGISEEELKRDSFSVNPRRTTSRETEQSFTASQELVFEGENISNLNIILDASSRAGANVIRNTRFFLSDEAQKEAEKALLDEAVRDARAKAESIADADSRTIGKSTLLDTQITSSQPFARVQTEAVDSPTPSVDTTLVEYSVSVRGTFELR